VFDAQRPESMNSLAVDQNPVYAEVIVTAASVSLWGLCVEKAGTNEYILEDKYVVKCSRYMLTCFSEYCLSEKSSYQRETESAE
jgi:hypothetical protein